MRRARYSQSLKQYLLLIRLPNIFTIPSNIFAGYFSSAPPYETNLIQLSMLTASSALLYVYGMALNDYFDVQVDRLERPYRPLPSGQIPRKNALVMAIVAVLLANVIASLVSVTSLAISVALSALIFAYDYRAKNGRLGPLFMGAARFLNVILGASAAVSCFLWCSADVTTTAVAHPSVLPIPWRTLFAAGVMFAYIYAITLLSKREAGEQKSQALGKTIWQSFSIIVAIVAATVFLAFYLDSVKMLISIVIFSAAVFYAWKQSTAPHVQNIQHGVRDLLLSIIILDSIFITAFAGPYYYYYGTLVLLLIIPPIFLAKKKIYAT